ncbi:hypothetical protein ABOM_002788 [Aspergillus bombycis]|uniref:Uncharacterized protein n=1 Tax=Aspergillus bombycis TaxID=109264 RepID=A0A1F8A8F7_9EURO|nr:hypothetical protein ABOM_002788 [Aspergillus bombycis]OGM48012.1 hypothetical protein ABOM_002788 [Aspergillus bombycis]
MASSAASERTESVSSHSYKKSLSSKADPNAALREDQPIANAIGGTSLFSLRSMQHRDAKGDIIADPDRSNPTRPRLERPLDTIRGFEAAIEARRRENAM